MVVHLKLEYYLLYRDKLTVFASATFCYPSFVACFCWSHCICFQNSSLHAGKLLRSLLAAQMLFVLESLYMDVVTQVI